MSNYATKADLKGVTGGDTSNIAAKSDLASLKAKVQGGPQKCPYFSLAITFTKIRKPSRFFLYRYWKFIEFFW